MSKRILSAAELDAHFRDQLGVLQRIGRLYDDGYISEARRLAVALRVLFHTGKSRSLLKMLGREHEHMVDTSSQPDPVELLASEGLVTLRFDSDGASYAPKLDSDSPERRIPFHEWWSGIVFSDGHGRTLTRRDVVVTAANQDGGAHVDKSIRDDYADLRIGNSLGWVTGEGVPPRGDARYAAIRQIAHETLKSFIPGYSKRFEDVQADRSRADVSNGKMRFYPHKSKFFVNNLIKPITPGGRYLVEIAVDSITTGSAYVVVNSTRTAAVNRIGLYREVVIAGENEGAGVLGELTDAVISRVSIRELRLERP